MYTWFKRNRQIALSSTDPSLSDFYSELLTSSDEHAPGEAGMHVFPRFVKKKRIFSVISYNAKGLTYTTEAFLYVCSI